MDINPDWKIEIQASLVKILLNSDKLGYMVVYVPARWLSGYSVRLAVGRPGFNSLVESYQKTLKMVFTASLLGAQHYSVKLHWRGRQVAAI